MTGVRSVRSTALRAIACGAAAVWALAMPVRADVADLVREYGISVRLTFSNSLLTEEHLSDKKCNALCALFEESGAGVILTSDLLLEYLKQRYPGLYFVSSTTKVLTSFDQFKEELDREEFRFVVPDFRLNKAFDRLATLSAQEKQKVEFLCNECCWFDCPDRKACYENVSRKSLGEPCVDHICVSPTAELGYRFSTPCRIQASSASRISKTSICRKDSRTSRSRAAA